MAIQSSFYLVDGSTRTFPSTKHIATKQHCAVYLKNATLLTWSVVPVANYSLINNGIVFDTAPSSTLYSEIEIRVVDTQVEIVDSPSNIAIVATNIASINADATNISSINTVAANIGSVTTVSGNTANINSVANNMAELLTVNDNANLVYGLYDQFDDRYLGSKSVNPTLDNDGNALLIGALYFDSIQNIMRVYSSVGWVSANTGNSSNVPYTIENVTQFTSIPSGYATVIVKDLDRGGTFIWSATGTANGGTVFAGATGYWNRQYSGAVNVKWFGAIGDGVADDTTAIKATLVYAESLSSNWGGGIDGLAMKRPIVTLGNGNAFYVTGNNPVGIQTSTLLSPNTYQNFAIELDGAGSKILWRPTLSTDALFSNLGRNVFPRYHNFSVSITGYTIGADTHIGTIFRSTTDGTDASHRWRSGNFSHISIDYGVHTVFDIAPALVSSVNDTTLVENMYVRSAVKIMYMTDSEAVDWKFHKCTFYSYANNVTYFDIACDFAGGMTVDSCEFLINDFINYTVVKSISTANNKHAFNLINCRLESRGTNAWVFFNVKAGHYYVEGIHYTSGNPTGTPNAATRFAILGDKASVTAYNCTLPAFCTIDEQVNAVIDNTALSFNRCQFYGLHPTTSLTISRANPVVYIRYTNLLEYTVLDAIKALKNFRSVKVESPVISTGGIFIDHKYGIGAGTELKKVVIGNRTTSNTFNLNINTFELPTNIVITSIKLFHRNVNTTKVNNLNIRLYIDYQITSIRGDDIPYAFLDNNNIYGVELLPANKNFIAGGLYLNLYSYYYLGGTLVTNEADMPNGWIEVTYRGINSAYDVPVVTTDTAGLSNVL